MLTSIEKVWRILGLNNWWISPHKIHRFYASLAPLLERHTTTINRIMYRKRIVKDSSSTIFTEHTVVEVLIEVKDCVVVGIFSEI